MKCGIFRGGFQRFTNFPGIASEGEGFVIMWKSGEQYPRLHISSVPLAAFWQDGFDPTQWTICLFWEPSDRSQPDVPSPKAEEPPTNNDGTPAYSDPNIPIQPPPGLGPQDVDMPPPDEEMPAVQNSQQPPDDPPPPGARRRSRSRDRQPPPALPQPTGPGNHPPGPPPRGRSRSRER